MKCAKPFIVTGGQVVPCGQCLTCRVNRRRIWTHRIMLESLSHSASSFVTLTYSDANLPMKPSSNLPSLSAEHVSSWLKRLRDRVKPQKLRFFAVGEYGDQTERPHYHVALFGLSNCHWGGSRYGRLYADCCRSCDLVRDSWGLGNVYLGTLTQDSAQYVAGYVVKKMTGKDDIRLQGRDPEFCRMSRRPGIGANSTHDLANDLLRVDFDDVDVPVSISHGKKNLPLGRYLRGLLRERIGRSKEAPEVVKTQRKEELRPLLEIAQRSPLPQGVRLSATVAEFFHPETLQAELRQEFYKQRKVL